ncbi:hypothetical protein CAI16_08030 [Virgibacillus dokdonensis]|uniref:N-acetyltransferase domain-containing protein n=1 Tax=Virgibacillus dokdonensis TaxID=302167 RepID=A0A3E0WUD9_9BACI|nr:GNAT family N-acetyltransferase [Virgibacillus dokdonensis]RFA35577.1 hypothetical protein CAI16_08030 [Virgibacillus dokdonensis]
MFTYARSNNSTIFVEKNVFNTNKIYNQIAFDKQELHCADIVQQHMESKRLQTERYVIQNNGIPMGILEYGMHSPRTNMPWLTLLLIDKKYQGKGLAKNVYLQFETWMQVNGAPKIQIAVHANNEKALLFWSDMGFRQYDERVYQAKRYYSLEKRL